MSNETNRTRYILPKLSWGNYNTLMKIISPELSDPTKFRLQLLGHYYKFGYKSVIDAFGVKKSTLCDWKRGYEQREKRNWNYFKINMATPDKKNDTTCNLKKLL